MTAKQISAEEFDRKFDEGEDISDYVDWDHPVVEPGIGTIERKLNTRLMGGLGASPVPEDCAQDGTQDEQDDNAAADVEGHGSEEQVPEIDEQEEEAKPTHRTHRR